MLSVVDLSFKTSKQTFSKAYLARVYNHEADYCTVSVFGNSCYNFTMFTIK